MQAIRSKLWKTAAALALGVLAAVAAPQGAGGIRAWGEVPFVTESASSTAPLVQVAGNPYGAIARHSDGAMVSWGIITENSMPYGLTSVKQVEASFAGVGQFALKKDGTVVQWGGDFATMYPVPSTLANVVQISASDAHVAALKSDGTVVCWGYANTNEGRLKVPPGLTGVVQVSAAGAHTLARKSDGTVVKWGTNGSAPPAGLTGVVDISSGQTHDIALKSDGSLVIWGSNSGSELTPPPGLTGVVKVAAGDRFSAVLKSDGTVVCWGTNAIDVSGISGVVYLGRSYGALYMVKADGTAIIRSSVNNYGIYGGVTVPPNLSGVIQAAAGYRHSVAVMEGGSVYCFGNNDYGQLDAPAGLTGVTSVSCGQYFTAAVKSDGTVVCWGLNDAGQCSVPAGLTGVVQVATGPNFVIARKSDGTLVAWGSDAYGLVTGAAGRTNIAQVSTNDLATHVIALKSDGTVQAWGYNAYHQCDPPAGLTGVVQVALFENESAALKADGTTAMWGQYNGTWDTIVSSIAGGGRKIFGIRTNRSRLTSFNYAPNEPILDVAGIASVSGSMGPPINGYFYFSCQGGTLALPSVVVSVAPYQTPLNSTVTGTIFLPKPAPAGGAKVLLVTDNVDVAAPGSVTVPAGLRSATFPINVGSGAGLGVWRIEATYNNYTSVAALTTANSPLASVSAPTTMVGNSQTTGTITLSQPAAAGYSVHLNASNSNVAVPTTVSFAAGATTATFTVTSADVSADASSMIIATDSFGGSANATIAITPNNLLSLSLNPTTVIGGTTNVVTGTVTLAGAVAADTTVNLSVTTGGAYASVPATVTVPASSATGTFTVTHQNVTAKTYVTIAASRSGVSFTQKLTLNPNKLNSVTLSPGTVIGGSITVGTGTVNLRAAVTTDTVVNLASSDPAHASVPSTVTVLAGNRSATFTIVHTEVNGPTPVTISASWQADHPSAVLTVNRNPVASMTLNRTSVVGSSSTTVRLTVKLAATVSHDTTVTLSSSDPSAANVPTTAIVPAGTRVVTVVVTHSAVGTTKIVQLSASHGGITETINLTVTP